MTFDPSLHPYHFTCLDWIGHLVNQPSIWAQYDASLKTIWIDRSTLSTTLKHQMARCIDAPLTHHTLMYRYAIMTCVVAEEFTFLNYLYLTPLMASTSLCEAIFSPLPPTSLWEQVRLDINHFRENGFRFREYLISLANSEDVKDDRCLTDHGILSSFSLLYGLHLVYFTLSYQYTLYPTSGLKQLHVILGDTLAHLIRSVHS